MTEAFVRTKVHHAFDVHLNFTAQVTFYGVGCVDVFADGQNFGVGQLVYTASRVDVNSFADGFSRCGADTGDICEGDWYPLCFAVGMFTPAIRATFAIPFRCGSVVPDPFFTT